MIVGLREAAFEPWPLLAEAAQTMGADERAGCGASDVFVGAMRAGTGSTRIVRLQLEHYPGMTERTLARIAADTCARWPIRQLVLVHRVGEALPGETLIVAAVWSAHRDAVFAACRHLVEAVKHQAPFWKREFRADGTAAWVAANTPARM